MYGTILVPTDGSPGTDETLDHALAIARDHAATLHVLHVIERRVYRAASSEDQENVLATLREEGEAAIAAARERAEAAGVDVVSELRDGVPYRDILEYADEHDVDLVVMGTHGRTGRDRLVNLGSVTERVVKNTDRPVLVVSIGEQAE